MQIRPVAIGRANWLFAGSLRAGKRAAALMSLIQSAKLNGLNPYAYLRDVLERLPTHPDNRIDEFLPHNWTGSVTAETEPPPQARLKSAGCATAYPSYKVLKLFGASKMRRNPHDDIELAVDKPVRGD